MYIFYSSKGFCVCRWKYIRKRACEGIGAMKTTIRRQVDGVVMGGKMSIKLGLNPIPV